MAPVPGWLVVLVRRTCAQASSLNAERPGPLLQFHRVKRSSLAVTAAPRRGASPANRSLQRGIEILRAFRPGSDLLGNGDLAERTGLARATVSRLTQTLVGSGLLQHDASTRAYRLAAPVLSLAHAMRTGSPVLQAAAPLMRKVAEGLRINVGLAVADGAEMVYLESIRYNRKVSLRNVVSGQRVPMELTSLGRAYLAAIPEPQRAALMAQFKAARRGAWPRLEREIEEARAAVRRQGCCVASWQPEVVALATPLVVADEIYVLNASMSTTDAPAAAMREFRAPLLDLAEQIRGAFERRSGDS
jgi:DNA-binding IclR family transcriptional regulator